MQEPKYELTNPQKSIWVTEEYYKGTAINNICGTATIHDKLDFDLLKQAMQIVIKSNAVLKLKFSISNGEVFQTLSDEYNSNVLHYSVKDVDELAKIRDEQIASKPFDLLSSFAYGFYTFELPDGTGGFIINMHHILADSWTLGLLSKQVVDIYSYLVQGKTYEIKTNSYLDYISSEQEYKSSERYKKDKAYWLSQFETIPEIANIPSSKSHSVSLDDCNGKRMQYKLDKKLISKLKLYCQENHISLYNFFMAIYSIYLRGITGLNDFSIGTPILNRTNPKEKNTAGMFINMAPLRINFTGICTFKDFIKNISVISLGMLKHQKYSYQSLLEELRKEKGNIGTLYNTVFSYQITNTQSDETSVSYSTEWNFNGNSGDNLAIHVLDLNNTGSLNVCYDYKTSIYSEEDIENTHKRILHLIEQVISSENIELSKLEIVTTKEKENILNKFNNTDFEYDKSKTLIDLFEDVVNTTPENIAVIYDSKEYSYKQLNNMANIVAASISDQLKEKHQKIAVLCKKSAWTLASFLGIMKSGNSYIPIDTEYPEDRIKYILEDSNCSLIIAPEENEISKKYKNKIILEDLDDSKPIKYKSKANPEDLAYIIYTSGTTGKPKGVKIKHKNIVNTLIWRKNFYKFDKNITVFQVPSFSFDSSVEDIFTPLNSGSKLIIPSSPKIDVNEMCEAIQKYNVNHFLVVPSLYKILLLEKSEYLKTLKFVTIAGEAFNMTLVKEHFEKLPNVRLINEYGPTENSVCSTYYELTKDDEEIYIGKPINNCKCYVLNSNMCLLPENTPGELYVSGPGVSEGYLNKPEMTEAKFLDNPFDGEYKLYKTGDIVKLCSNGNLKFIGRIDDQVKLNGFRIELKEIEQNILQNKDIQDVVVAKKVGLNDKPILIAYIIAKTKDFDSSKLYKSLRANLPAYMVPTIVKLDSFPLTPNGKVDVKKLPLPDLTNVKKEIVEPRDEFDKKLIDIVSKTLHVSNISLNDTIFTLGGDSLSAITLSAKLSSEYGMQVGIKELLSDLSIQDLADLLKGQSSSGTVKTYTIEKAPKQEFYPLSSAQRRIYYNTKMVNEKNTVYNLPGYIIADELLDKNKLQNVFNTIINRHSALRTSFVVNEDKIVQKVADSIDFEIPVFENTEDEMEDIIRKFPKPFNLEKAPLFRAELHYIDKTKTLLLIDSHHIVMDGAGLNNLILEINSLYSGKTLDELPINYTDYSVWENKFNLSDKIVPFENYWVHKFEGSEFSELNLPYDFNQTTSRTYKGTKISKSIDKKLFKDLQQLSVEAGISPYMLFLSALFILLYKYTGQDDINIGTPIVNRDIEETQKMIGMFVNNIVVRGIINHNLTFKEFLNDIKNQTLNDLSNQPYPFDMLVKKSHLPMDNTRNPLFDVFFVYQNSEETHLKLDNKKYEINEIANNISKFNLSLEIKPTTNTVNIEYRTDLFKQETIDNLFNHYINLLTSILGNINQKISDISILSEQEKNKILCDFNDTYFEYDKSKTISQLFEEQVEKTPNNIALVFENKKLTYKELNEKANQLANYLRIRDIKPNDIIGIMLPRSLELLIAIIGVLKSGACYIPIDPTFPGKRIDYMLENSDAKLLITTNELYNNIDFENKICITSEEIYTQNHKDLENINNPEDLSYIIYTSGSTGLPKGVMLKHKSLSNLCAYLNRTVEFLQEDSKFKNMISVTTASFDIFIFETLICLQKGLKIILANEDEQRIPALLDILIRKNNAELIQMTPSRMQIFLDNIEDMPNLSNLKYVTLAGEPLPLKLRDDLITLGVKKVYNGYGPSETTVFSSFTDVTKLKEIHIGKPLANTQMYVLDSNLKPVPIGIAGELYIAGDGVGKGYLNREDITKKSYIANPFESNSIMYKSGDLCKFDEDGNIYCLGRADNQIKIRGLRIELGEIENKIVEFPYIQKAKVVKQIIGNREIISAYYISARKIKPAELRRYLYENLPKYMVPSYFTPLDKFPYTPNGKIDKNALPVPNGILQTEKSKYIAPKTDLEVRLVAIWEEILNTKPIGINDNFFELGGDSILAMNLNIRLLKITDKIKYSDIFTYPTIASLVEKIESESSDSSSENLSDLSEKYNELLLNNVKYENNIVPKKFHNVLITGGTGFLGIHILGKFLKTEKGKAYVIIRKDPGSSVQDKLRDKLHYYFGSRYDKYLNNRIVALEGDISKDGFGLNQEELFSLGNSIDIIINSAAKVSHYGSYQSFYNANVKSVQKIIDFANLFNIELFHISTLSIAGDGFVNIEKANESIDFSEKDFYIGQTLNNVYIKSKFEAEKIILDAVLRGTKAHIIRVGNLMPRLTDGKFQENIDENAFIGRIKTFLQLKIIPDYLLDRHIELTPIDSTATAILKIVKYTSYNNIIYHVFNHNYLYINKFIKILNSLNIDVQTVSSDDFKKVIKEILNDPKSDILNNLINDLDKDLNLNYDNKINTLSNYTVKFLKRCGFEWPKIDKDYISKILKLIKGE